MLVNAGGRAADPDGRGFRSVYGQNMRAGMPRDPRTKQALVIPCLRRNRPAWLTRVTRLKQLHRGLDVNAHSLRVRDRLGATKHGLFLLFVCVMNVVFAHDPGLSTAQGELRADALSLTTGFAPADAENFLPLALRSGGTWTPAEFVSVHERLVAIAPQLWEVRSGRALLTARDIRVELLPGDNVSFQMLFPRAGGDAPLILRAVKLSELPSGHRQFVVITDERGSTLTKKLMKAEDATLEVPVNGSAGTTATMPSTTGWEFIKLGVEHIWTGYDHLLFLFALLLVCRSFRSIVGIVSCFTIAHSLTLALATLNIVKLPGSLVEPAIAASIVFVGAENLVRRGEEPRGRWALTFVFGLIHGFGFASVLGDLGVGSGGQGIGMPLFTFNLGVELGQIVIASAVLPIVWQLRKREWFVRRGVPVLSGLVALAGLYWLLERTLFS
jgi:hydrogenase/urease accessory protein HupE